MLKYSSCSCYYLHLDSKYFPKRNVTFSPLCQTILHAPVTIFLLTPNILLNALLLSFPYVKYSSCSCYYLPLNSKYSPKRNVTFSPLRQNILHAPVTIYLLTPNILVNALLLSLPYVKLFLMLLLLSTYCINILSTKFSGIFH
jgi:hypothetical protein